MTVESKESEEYQEFKLSKSEEAAIKRKVKDPSDPLKILIVTAKLQTGFNAPNLGAIGIDKTMRDHTLFQAMTRVNRPWINPTTGQRKSYGRIIDYIGLGSKLVTALGVKIGGTAGEEPYDVDELCSYFLERLQETLKRFESIDQSSSGYAVLSAAQQLLAGEEESQAFAKDYLELQSLFEFLWPREALVAARSQYLWLAKIYNSMQPAKLNLLLWQKFGAKTQAIVDASVTDIAPPKPSQGVDPTYNAITGLITNASNQIYSGGELSSPLPKRDTDAMIKTIRDRIEARMQHADDHVALRYHSLAERLDRLRQMQLATAEESQLFLKMILSLATETVEMEREAEQEEAGSEIIAPDPRRKALTQIFIEYKPDFTPDILERIVNDIDHIVVVSSFKGWQERSDGDKTVKREIRKMLKSYGLEPAGELFDRIYTYVRANY
jgi:type I restriction enzyme R subunit